MAITEHDGAASSRTTDPVPLLTLGQVAELVGVPASTLRRWDAEGQGPERVRFSTRTIRYRHEAVERWLDERSHRPGTAE